MEGTYGIGVANRYELFYVEGEDVDVDDQETLQKPKKVAAVAPAAPAAAAPKKPVAAAAKAPAPASKAPAAAAAGGQKVLNAKENIRGDGQQRGPKATPANGTGGAPRQGGNATGGAGAGPRQGNNKENRSNNAGGEQRALNGEKRQSGPRRDGDRPPRNSGEGGANVERKNRRNENFRGGDREGGAGGANGGEGGAPRRRFNNDGAPRNGGAGGDRAGGNRKREFDRQSGSDKTGVKAVGKRDGGGAHNWGSDKQEINYALNDVQETNGEYENQDAHNVSGEEGKDTSAGEAGEASPPAPKELTLDEYKALKAANRAKLQTYSLLGDEKAPASAAPAATAAAAPAQVSAEDAEHLSQRAGRQKQIFDVNFHFGEGNRRRQRRNEGEEGGRPGGERGERREGGGGGGRREGGGGGERRDGGNRGERREPRQAGGEAEGGQDGQRERRPRFNRDDNNRNNRNNNNNNDRTSFNNRGGRNAAAAPQQPPRVDEFNFPSLG